VKDRKPSANHVKQGWPMQWQYFNKPTTHRTPKKIGTVIGDVIGILIYVGVAILMLDAVLHWF
jgi:hypothetical protein